MDIEDCTTGSALEYLIFQNRGSILSIELGLYKTSSENL